MTYPRRRFGPVSLEVPPGLVEDAAGEALVLLVAPAAPASLRIWTRDAAQIGSLAELTPAGVAPSRIFADDGARVWPGLRAEASGKVRYLFESEGVVYLGLVECPGDLWGDYGVFLEGTMLSLGGAPSPTLPLFPGEPPPLIGATAPKPDPVAERRKALAAVQGDVAGLIAAGRFDEAEAMIFVIDSDIGGAVALADLYEEALAQSPADTALFDRAVAWAHRCWPEPHTAIEAEDHAAGAAAREARLRAMRDKDPQPTP